MNSDIFLIIFSVYCIINLFSVFTMEFAYGGFIKFFKNILYIEDLNKAGKIILLVFAIIFFLPGFVLWCFGTLVFKLIQLLVYFYCWVFRNRT